MSATITILGRIGRDPESAATQNGGTRTRFSVASNRKFNGQDVTDWYDVTFFGKRAENAQKYLKKGSAVQVTGELEPNTKDGKTYLNVEGYTWNFVPKSSESSEQTPAGFGASPRGGNAPVVDDSDSSLPF